MVQARCLLRLCTLPVAQTPDFAVHFTYGQTFTSSSSAAGVCTDVHILAELYSHTRYDTLAPPSTHMHIHILAHPYLARPHLPDTAPARGGGGGPQLLSLLQADQPASMPEHYIWAVSEPQRVCSSSLHPVLGVASSHSCSQSPGSIDWPCSSAARDVPQLEGNTYNLWSV